MAKESSTRLNWLDTLRGVVIILMILYHTCWDLVYIYGMSIGWFSSKSGFVLQQIICFGFILIAGYSVHLGSHGLRHGLVVFGAGIVVTLVTLVFLPSVPIYIGVLTFIGSAVLLATVLSSVLNKMSPVLGMVIYLILFLLFRNVNQGYLGFFGIPVATLSGGLYKNWLTTYLGFPFPGFHSSDYFSLLPWIFLFLVGYYFYSLTKNTLAKTREKIGPWGAVSFMGRHSLIIYMLHQVVIYMVLDLLHLINVI